MIKQKKIHFEESCIKDIYTFFYFYITFSSNYVNDKIKKILTKMTTAHTIWLMIRMNDRTKTYLGAFGCLLVAAIWGSAFVFMKDYDETKVPAWAMRIRLDKSDR